MPIDMKCRCGRKASVPDSLAGKKGKCPACGEVMEVPVPTPTPASVPEASPASDTIELQCPSCSRKFRVSDVAAGKKWRCRCGEMVDVPFRAGFKPPRPLVVEDEEEAIALDESFDGIKTEENYVSLVPDRQPQRKSAGSDEFGLQRVVVVNFDMPFKTLVVFIVKVALASIPAMIILWTITFVIGCLFWLVLFLFGLMFAPAPRTATEQPSFNRSIENWQPTPITKTAPGRMPNR